MKKLLVLFLMLSFLMGFDAFAQTGQDWKWMHQTPQGNTLRWVKAWTQNVWYAVGYAGTFMKTTNAGATWDFNHFAGGPFGVSGQRTNNYDAYFFNLNTGFIASSSGYVVRTTNAGATFDTVNVGNTGNIYGIGFANVNTGYAVTSATTGRVVKTTNGGVNWSQLSTPNWTTTSYQLFVMDSNKVYVCTSGGTIHLTTDGGATWTAQTTGVTTALYRIYFSDANNGFATGASGKFIYTTNGGTIWTLPTNTGLPTTTTYYDIEARLTVNPPVDKINEGFEGTTFPPDGWTAVNTLGTNVWNRSTSYYHSGVASAFVNYQSTGGEDWLISKKINGIAAGDSIIFWVQPNATGWAPDSLNVKVSSTDSLVASFTTRVGFVDVSLLSFQWYRYAFSLSAFAGQNIYIGFQHKDVDGCGVFLDDVRIPGSASTSSTVLLTGSGIAMGTELIYMFKSTNNGASWDSVGHLSPTQPWASTYYSADYIGTSDSIIAVGAFGLINKRNNASSRTCFTNFQFANTLYDVWAQSINGLVIAVGASSSAGAVFDQILRSTNGGTTWSIVNWTTAATAALNSIDMINGTTGWAVGTNSTVLKTTNAGLTWDSLPAAVTGMAPTLNLSKVDFVDVNTGYIFSKTINGTVGDTTTIFKTTNAGANWTKLRLTGAVGTTNYIYGAYMLNANTGWIVNYTPRPYMTTDGGVTWTQQAIVDVFGGFMYDVKMANATTGYISGSSGKIYKTTNGGTLWDTISKPTNATYAFNALEVINPTTVLVVGATGTTLYTSNSGTSWGIYNTSGSTINGVYQFNDGKAFAVGSSGYMWKNTNMVTGTGSNISEIPGTYELAQNYPNPFNPTTTIKFAIPKAGLVTIKVYDIVGREITRIVNNQFYNAGWNNVLFNASELSSGVYFYSMIVDNNVIGTKKMVLLK